MGERKTGRDHEKGREREKERKRMARKRGKVKETSEFGVQAPKLNAFIILSSISHLHCSI